MYFNHYLQGFIHPRWCRISAINSMWSFVDFLGDFFCYCLLWSITIVYYDHPGCFFLFGTSNFSSPSQWIYIVEYELTWWVFICDLRAVFVCFFERPFWCPWPSLTVPVFRSVWTNVRTKACYTTTLNPNTGLLSLHGSPGQGNQPWKKKSACGGCLGYIICSN